MDPQKLISYRPVSNLSYLSKLLEKVILDQLMDYLVSIEVLPDTQSAYKQLYSTETTLCRVANDILCLMDEGKCGLLLLLDLSAAFDTVIHDVLLDDLRAIGVTQGALTYLQSYLHNRSFCVQVGNTISEHCLLRRGVPQGSVLGPILFCIYTIELSHLLEEHEISFNLFADDTQFYLCFRNIQDTENVLNRVMTDVKRWMDSKQLKLNEDKTECLIIGKKCALKNLTVLPHSFNVLGTEIKVLEEVKDLGVTLDKHLSLNEQINKTVKVARFNLRNIAFIRRYLDEKSIKMLVQNQVINRLDYCNSLYYKLPKYQLRKMQLIMNKAARLIKSVSPYDRITPVLIELHWLPIQARIVYKVCVLTFQAMMTGKPEYIRKLLTPFNINTSIVVRHASEEHRLFEPRSETDIGFRAFKMSAPRLYNKLPKDVKDSPNITLFKKRLKTFLFTDCYDLDSSTITEPYAL